VDTLTHAVLVILISVSGVLAIALELLLLHALAWAKQWLEIHVQADTMRTYAEIVRAAVDFAEEWGHKEQLAHRKPFEEDKLRQAVLFATAHGTVEDNATLRLNIHSELGRRRSIRSTALVRTPPPPLPKP
jgi:hypothetical protein